ncbi:hypothetical protein AA103196_0758 [Ameyamaea chiangmaiensis NBRC 103196]|uniref:Uncharacterized protein n=1 Tax=Ameyamaea chiangmaiensis TaxID=442969 RepID=A0A850PBV4_9PROT|nr:hypothetical protein [Ameyamaea chiangmaiensis]MBS4075861.1 hypothetical protein [Ameyamaea chiangmaiensis]NVN42015.1 hypothetical protein [Ameyamaea chiangmaiensis]GBQ64013.1 hypothetical protein AA103196_0758 [Ameyamaea chiangmaiensis NBRC 103196]
MTADTDAILWPQSDGAPVSCTEKLRVLRENYAEARQVLRDAFEDAVLMGVDEASARRLFAELVETLPSPRHRAAPAAA